MPFGKKKDAARTAPGKDTQQARAVGTGPRAASDGKVVHTRGMPAVTAADLAAARAAGQTKPVADSAATAAATAKPGAAAPAKPAVPPAKPAEKPPAGPGKAAPAANTTANTAAKPAAKPAAKKPAPKKKKKRRTLGAAIAALPPFRALGNMFYSLGFYAEVVLMRVWRLVRDALRFIGQLLGMLFGSVFGAIGRGIRALWHDITSPFVRFHRGIGSVRAVMREEKKKKHGHPTRAAVGYFTSGVRVHGHLALNLLGIALPVLALAAFAVTAYSILSADYGLAVEMNGQVLGYVTDQSVVDDAQSMLRMRLRLAEGQSETDMHLEPTVTVARTSGFSTKQQLVNTILRSGNNDIVEGTGLVVDGQLVAVTTEGERLRTYLDGKLTGYFESGRVIPTVSFVRSVECDPKADDVFFTSSVKSYDEIIAMLEQTDQAEKGYTADGEATLGEVASAAGVPFETLLLRNPAFQEADAEYVPEAGSYILLERAQPYLQVQVTYREPSIETLPYETIENEDDTLFVGQSKVQQQGENGKMEVWHDQVYIDGELVRRVQIESENRVLKEAVPEVLLVGTKSYSSGFYGDGSGGIEIPANLPPTAGGYMWPVPGYSYSSRGMAQGHRGQDINAATGTPIFAAQSGVVVYAGWHYSFGYYVQIAHGDGMSTLYAHCSSLAVVAGQTVAQGEYIAAVGSTGNSSGPHCHFEVHDAGGGLLNPLSFVVPPHGLGM